MRFSRVLIPCGYRPKVEYGAKPVQAPQQMFAIKKLKCHKDQLLFYCIHVGRL